MGSKTSFLVLALAFAVVVLIVSDEVAAARELASNHESKHILAFPAVAVPVSGSSPLFPSIHAFSCTLLKFRSLREIPVHPNKWNNIESEGITNPLNPVSNIMPETEFIANIVETIYYKLDLKLISTPAHLTGIETRAEAINSWLKDEHSDTNVLAICGMGGSGKTTLGQYIFNSNKHNFESSSFVEEIGKHFKETYGLLRLQKQLLTDMLGGKNKVISCVSEGATKINKALHLKRVLLILDDIDEHDQLGTLLGTSAVYTQSKIIITTRHRDINTWFESRSCRCCVHEIKLLNDHESLEVFSCHAFGSKHPLEGFSDLAVELAQYCGGNPLALKVLGSSLFVSAGDPRERKSLIEIWKSRLNSLSSMKGDLDCRIRSVLQKSFDSLPLVSYKELFLHIVAFFVGKDEDYVVKLLEYDCHAKAGIRALINRCLLTLSPNKKLMMHQLILAMGSNIVCENSKDPARHTRVWSNDEAYRVLTKGQGSETIEGLTLDTRKLKKGTKVLTIKTSSLARMHKLKLLQLKHVKLKGYNKNFPELRWLSWHGFHLKTIPSGLLMSNFLVAIDMPNGNIKSFEPPMVLNSLKILNLEACEKLISVCKLWLLPNLETLILWRCFNLTHVCETIGDLKYLALLNLAGCEKLWKSSWNKKRVNKLERIKALCIGGGVLKQAFLSLPRSLKLVYLDYYNPEYHNDLAVIFNGPLSGLSLRGNKFEFMPSNIDLKMLRVLNLTSCINLKSIMCLPSTLEELYIYDCISLEKVTFQSGRFRLRKFGCDGCSKLCEVQGLFKLVAIKELDEADLGDMKWIKSYQDFKVDLVVDEITQGRNCHIQMLKEYGIRSTYLQGVKDQSMMTSEYTSTSAFLSFRVSLPSNQHRVKGLNVSCLYRSLGYKDKDKWMLFTTICNRTKDATWIYNPVVYCKLRDDKDILWSSYWAIGNTWGDGDAIYVVIIVEQGLKVSKCGASLVYMDHDEDTSETATMEMEEVVGGDLSEFEVTPGVYYLCRRDFFKLWTPDLIKGWFGGISYFGYSLSPFSYSELQGWRKSYESQDLDASCMHLVYTPELHRDTLFKGITLGYSINSKSNNIRKIKKVVSSLVGVDFVHYNIEEKALYVLGHVDSMAVEARVREFDKVVKITSVDYNVNPSLKWKWRFFIYMNRLL
ncbi:hypothetical protein SSX86_024510 [Deinandra increscens subsp. villosa]|uniref:NB-ARC domain-containing protein n=1 Tax=Deinandra increscens subsp. villosa TaxID=3103831 RepID=A0AAP0CPP3_9ASTR